MQNSNNSSSGGLYGGCSREWNMTSFVSQAVAAGKPVIAVSINYRLNAFGFLWGSHELTAKGSANNGLRDQRTALRWLQENIAAFGGDPRKVTIFGQSAGGLSVGKQLVAYGGRDDGLFRAAIMQSGSMAEKWPYNVREPMRISELSSRQAGRIRALLPPLRHCTRMSMLLACRRSIAQVRTMTRKTDRHGSEAWPHRCGREYRATACVGRMGALWWHGVFWKIQHPPRRIAA